MPSVYPGYVEFNNYTYDVAEAKRLLAEAGYANGFQTTLTYSAGDPVQENIAVLLKSTLSQVGINIDLRKQPVSAHSDVVQSKKPILRSGSITRSSRTPTTRSGCFI